MGAMKGVATMTLWGFLLLIVLPLVLVLILILVGSALDRQDRKRRGEEDYDERQQYYRGRAYGYAFWTLAGCMLAWGVLDVFADWPWLHDVWNVAGGCLCLAVLVFVLYCIRHDAYRRWKEQNQTAWAGCFLAVGGANTAAWMMSEVRLDNLPQLFLGLGFLVVGLATLIHRRRQQRREAEEA